MRKTLIVIDGNWYLHRVWYTLHTKNPDKGDALALSFISKVCVDTLAVKATNLVVAFDGNDVFRYNLFPAYKANRRDTVEKTDTKSDIYSYLPKIIRKLKSCGIQVVQLPKYEADDILCSIAHQYKETHQVICGTVDKDSFQYLSSSVRLYDSAHKFQGKPKPRFLGPQHVKLKIGLPPRLSVAYQTLIGDSTDGVPRIVSPAKARKALLEYGSIKAWALADKDARKVLRKNKKALILNKKLVTLVKDCVPDFTLQKFRPSQDNTLPRSYHALCNLLQPKSKGLF